ncbi:hypothetical protein MBLNU13_g03151t2 [Cladosporium sp. NU13]
MAPLWPWKEPKVLRTTVRSEVAKNEFLHGTLVMAYREAMLLAAELGTMERFLKLKCAMASEKEKAAAQTKRSLESRTKNLNAKLFAEQHEAKKAAFAAETLNSAKAHIKRLSDDLAAEKRHLDGATKRIEELQQEHESLQETLGAAESTVQDLKQKLETAEKAVHTLQVKVGTLEIQLSKNTKQLRAELAAEMQEMQAQIMKDINSQMAPMIKALADKNSVPEQKCNGLERQLAEEQDAKAKVVKELEASRKTEKAACDKVQQREQEHQQQINNIKAAEKAQRDNSSEQNARQQKKLHEDLTKAREHNKKQALEAKLEKTSGFVEKYSNAAADASRLRTELAAAKLETQTQTDKYLTLSGVNNLAKEKYAELERDNGAIQASLKQQQDANTKLVAEYKEKINRNTQHANKLQRDVDGLHAEMQNKDNELSKVRVDKAKLTEKFNDDAATAAAKSRKLLQEEQSKNKT